MIIVKFDGGLGNQMFQYAMYISLQKRYPTTKVIGDCLAFKFQKKHNGFELTNVYNIDNFNYLITHNCNCKPYSKYFFRLTAWAIKSLFKSALSKKYIYIYDDNIFNNKLLNLDVNKNYYLDGYWGNEKYFEGYKAQIYSSFTSKSASDNALNASLTKIRSTRNSASLHIRRGDYIRKDSQFQSLADSQYYLNSIKYLGSKLNNPTFYIFSDDIVWCKIHMTYLERVNHYFIEGNKGRDSYKDILLMSNCKHNVIANSTFSWWGAWLNLNPQKIVVCPTDLFINSEKNHKVKKEFYPENWIKIQL